MSTFLKLTSPVTQAAAPFSCGQVVPKNAWPDGSLKFAIVSGRAALTGGTPLSVPLSIGTPAGGTNLTLADLKAVRGAVPLAAGAFGTVSWLLPESIARGLSKAGAAAWIAAVKKAVQAGRGRRHAGSGEAHAARCIASSLHPLAMPGVVPRALLLARVRAIHRGGT